MGIPALPFSRINTTIAKPIKINETGKIESIGEHLKLKRLQLGLLQKDVAQMVGVSEDSVTYWESNRTIPLIRYMPKIIEFLGYNPMPVDPSTFSGKILQFRILNGLTYKAMGKLIGVNSSTITSWEQNHNNPRKNVKKRLEHVLQSK